MHEVTVIDPFYGPKVDAKLQNQSGGPCNEHKYHRFKGFLTALTTLILFLLNDGRVDSRIDSLCFLTRRIQIWGQKPQKMPGSPPGGALNEHFFRFLTKLAICTPVVDEKLVFYPETFTLCMKQFK